MPPRTAYSPTSRTVAVRSKPFATSHRVRRSIGITLPGATDITRSATPPLSGTRWTIALAVVKTTREPLWGASSAFSALIRSAETSALGDTRS